jgi:hypothetical protein
MPCSISSAGIDRDSEAADRKPPRIIKHSPVFDRIKRQMGIWGTDHIMTGDTNSDPTAGILLAWIEQHAEKRKSK